MFILDGFQPPLPPPPSIITTTSRKAISQFVHFPNKTLKPQFSLSFSTVLRQARSGNSFNVFKSRRKDAKTIIKTDDVDEEIEDEEEEEEEEDDDVFDGAESDGDIFAGEDDDDEIFGTGGDEDDEDEAVFVPMKSMKKWLENKPSGFGEGKVYDTPIEDKLMEEIVQSREAQLANLNKLKNNSGTPNSRKEDVLKVKATEVIPTGHRVRLLNLPKKRNVHRDLQVAFKEVPGIINIIPAVLGNKKTRDPICKGQAFVDFKSEKEAYRFVQLFSRQSITFGKIQKQINYQIVNPNSENSGGKDSQAVAPNINNNDSDIGVDDPSLDSLEQNDKHGGEDVYSGEVSSILPEPSESNHVVPRTEPVTESSSLEQQKKTRPTKKKQVTKKQGPKVPNFSIPGSANRLKIKEKAVLTDVFSKYGSLGVSAVKQQQD